MFNKPIINGVGNQKGVECPKNLISDAGVEISFESNSPTSLAEAINYFVKNKNNFKNINTRKFISENYSYRKLSNDYINIFR